MLLLHYAETCSEQEIHVVLTSLTGETGLWLSHLAGDMVKARSDFACPLQ